MPRTTETGGRPRAAASGRASRGRAAFRRGHGAEGLAAWWLRLKGYRILARNWRSAAGEIDLIARRGATLVIVEVKQRGDLVQAADALQARQRRRLARAAAAYLAARPDLAGLDLRFDVVVFGRWLGLRGRPIHLKDAWRPNSD